MFDMQIAGLYIRVNNRYTYLEKQCKDWIVDNADVKLDLVVEALDEEIQKEQSLNDFKFPAAYCESVCVYRAIANKLYMYDAFLLHSSVLRLDGEGYAFAAKSGVGKSTHTRYWLETFGERACVINGDKPIIRYIDGKFYAFGTPWRGKEKWGINDSVPLKACSLLMRGKENRIRKANTAEIVTRLFHQVLLPSEEPAFSRFMELIDLFMQEVPFYILECTLDKTAAVVAYEGMSKA